MKKLHCFIAAIVLVPTIPQLLLAEPRRIEIEATAIGLLFEPREFSVRPGEEIELVFRNQSNGMEHNLLIVTPGSLETVADMALDLGGRGPSLHWVPETDDVLYATKIVPPLQEETLRFIAPKVEEVYPFVCTIPGHAQTMRGRMRVTQEIEVAASATSDDSRGSEEERDAKPEEALRYERMDVGPFYSGVIEIPGKRVLDKGLAIRVGDDRQATVHFDTDLLRMSAGWTGGFLEFHSEHDAGIRNDPPPSVAGKVHFTSSAVTGWAGQLQPGQAPRFRDPRSRPFGPMPPTNGRYEGVYLHDNRVVLSYNAHGATIYETPWYLENNDTGAFVRDLHVEEQEGTHWILLFDEAGEVATAEHGTMQVVRAKDDGKLTVAAIHQQSGTTLEVVGGRAALRMEPNGVSTRTVRIWLWSGEPEGFDAFLALAEGEPAPADPRQWIEPGPVRWGEALTTRGERRNSDGPYAVDLLHAPRDNPYHALLHFTGLDFTEDGRAVLTTMHGDVWTVEGIDDSLEELSWTRFATGLNHPFGVRVVGDAIYVSGEDELTVLYDRNGNGEADYYENFCNLIAPGAGSWRQAFGLEMDEDGAFYFARGRGRWGSAFVNGVIRVSPDGNEMELLATGFRQPWAIGLSPAGNVTVSQQEGPWVPQTPVHMVDLESRQGNFYGFDPDNFRGDETYPRELGYEPPIVWLPRHVDNTGSGQVWVPSDEWGLPQGTMLHLSGGARLLQLFHEQVDGDRQGGVVPLARLRMWRPRMGRFNQADGQLYVVGPFPAGALERVRYTGEKAHVPIAFHAHENGVLIRFNHPVDSSATNVSRFRIHRWNYDWSRNYGSDFFSLENPGQRGQDRVDLTAVHALNRDGETAREFFLEIPDMRTAMQMRISYELEAADGTPMKEDLYTTIHALRPSLTGGSID